MNKINNKIIIGFFILILIPFPTFAETSSNIDGDNSVDIFLTGGELLTEISVLSLGDVIFGYDKQLVTNGNNILLVDDSRISGSGWDIKIKSTDFTQTLKDPTGGSGNITLKFPSSSLEVVPGDIEVIEGQEVYNNLGPYVQNLTLSNIGQSLVTAKEGFGMGKYSVPLNFKLTVPKLVTIEDISGSGSKYTKGEIIGLMEGTYTSTITYIIGSGL